MTIVAWLRWKKLQSVDTMQDNLNHRYYCSGYSDRRKVSIFT